MNHDSQYFEKLVLLLICLALLLSGVFSLYFIVPVMIALTISALGSWLQNERLQAACLVLFVVAAFYLPDLLFFLPLVSYDLFKTRFAPLLLLTLLPIGLHFSSLTPPVAGQIILITGLAFLLRQRNQAFRRLYRQALQLRDTAAEQLRQLEIRNQDLLDKQDYEVHLATLNERNRIAREIHDHVGHLLSRALLQVGALLAIEKNPQNRRQLEALNQTLSGSMDEIRHSLHDLRDASVDLQAGLADLTKQFEACPVHFEYSVETAPARSCVFAFLAIAREALANTSRHAKASQAWLIVREQPAFYQLIIRDNGIGMQGVESDPGRLFHVPESAAAGMGLQNMIERVQALNGQINFRQNPGLEIFVSVPKQPGSDKI